MTDIRRTILWVIFGFSLVMLWDQWQVYNGRQATFFPSGKPAATAVAPGTPTGALAGRGQRAHHQHHRRGHPARRRAGGHAQPAGHRA